MKPTIRYVTGVVICMETIVSYVDAWDIISLVLAVCSNVNDAIYWKIHRLNPRFILKNMIVDERVLLSGMREHRVMLMGPMVSNYFSPGSYQGTPAYDFHLPIEEKASDIIARCKIEQSKQWFMLSEFDITLRSIGFVRSKMYTSEYDTGETVVTASGYIEHKKQVIHVNVVYHSLTSPIRGIQFYTYDSTFMCYITGHTAVHLYKHIIDSHKVLRMLSFTDDETILNIPSVEHVTSSSTSEFLDYIEHRVLYVGSVYKSCLSSSNISINDYVNLLVEWRPDNNVNRKVRLIKHRYVGDRGCYTIDLNHYLSRPLMYYDNVELTLYYTWMETLFVDSDIGTISCNTV